MNKKIKELAEQAGLRFTQLMSNPMVPVVDGKETDLEKFAELIVAECCSKLTEMGEGWHEFARNPPDGQAHNASGALFAAYRLKEDAVDEIKQHFGVEE
jgi:glycerol-3-phosphate dehydrogenase